MANELTRIPKFRRCVLQNFPFIEQDFDALTDYELLCKVVEYLNKVIASQNEVVTITESLSIAFNQLRSFVEDYFANLDVQDEINNKLDQMAADGTLQEIIDAYLDSNITWVFDTVADMKLATNLINGSDAKTLGFYSINDGGGAIYHITDTGTANEMDVIAIGSSLYAHLIDSKVITAKQFSCYGDGSHDDTASLQQALDYASNHKCELKIEDGTYMVDATTSVFPKSNSTITFVNAKLKAIANDQEHSYVILLRAVHDIVFNDIVIEGERDSHTGATGEWGHCIYLGGSCNNIIFNNADLSNAWGDGVEMFAENENSLWKYPTNIFFNGMTYIHNCRRQGVSILAGEHIFFDTLYCKDINGTLPMSGIDIETEGLTWYCGDIHINYLKTEGTVKAFSLRNKGGITGNISVDKIEHTKPVKQVSGAYLAYSNPVTIFFDSYSTDSAKYSVNIGDVYTDYGTFSLNNAYLGATPTVHIDNIYSKNVVMINDADPNRSRGFIHLYYDKQCTLTNNLGGVYIGNVQIERVSEIEDRSINARWFQVYYNFNDNASKVFKECVINLYVVKTDANVNISSNPYPASNVVFDNVMISCNNPTDVVRSAGNTNTNRIFGGITQTYFLPSDSSGNNRTLTMRPTNAFIKAVIYAKGANTLRINTAYNTTYFSGVYDNGASVTPDGSSNYDIASQSDSCMYEITTSNKYIYVVTV